MSDPNPDASNRPGQHLPGDDFGSNNQDHNNDNSSEGESSSIQSSPPSSYTFNGHVVMGIGIILAIAAAATIYAMTVSVSPEVHASPNALKSPFAKQQNAAAQQSQATSTNQKVDKSFILVAKDFGWNGTSTGPTIKVNKGDTVKMTVINAGQMAHNFGIGKPSPEAMRLMNETKDLPYAQRMSRIPYTVLAQMPCPGCQKKFDEAHIEYFIRPDSQATKIFTANEAGHFKYFCMVRGHIWLGMNGDFIVENSPTSTVSAAQHMGGKT